MNQQPIKNVDPPEAHRILERDADAVLIDVRSRVEFEYVGHPIGAVHIPWKEFPDWDVNPRFVDDVAAILRERGNTRKDGPILAICRSGARSMAALQTLGEHGYTVLYNVDEGFEGDKDDQNHRNTVNGWRARGLPWEQS
jgi:rhodanese-related sulfurtransferase